MPGFLTTGVIIACFIEVGKMAEFSETLTSFANIGVIIALVSLTSHVGAGSSAHCLFADLASNRAISCSVAEWQTKVALQSRQRCWMCLTIRLTMRQPCP
jgi:hypothetical protein